MRLVRHVVLQFISAIALSLLTWGVTATAATPEQGREYALLKQAQPVEAGKKIEVIEFFAYYCPHCNALESLLTEWAKKNADRITFKRIHVLYPGMESQLKLFFALDALGKVDAYQSKVFQAYHVERNRLMTDEQVAQFVTKAGLDKAQFFAAYNSFTVRTKLGRIQRIMNDYEIESWPTLIIDGRYVTSPPMAAASMGRVTEIQQNQALLPVLDVLVARAQKEKTGAK